MMYRFKTLLLISMLALSATAFAHKESDAYLTLDTTRDATRIDGQWDIALRDLDFAIGLDTDSNGEITWGELKSRRAAIERYALSALSLVADGNSCEIEPRALLTDQHVDGGYAVLRFEAVCPSTIEQLAVKYTLLFEHDPNHKGLVTVRAAGSEQVHIFTSHSTTQIAQLSDSSSGNTFVSFVQQGIFHIWQGYDHLLFLLTLLLPAVLRREGRHWRANESLRDSLVGIAKIVTAFTVSHSITLVAASLGVVTLPSRWVESAIALTVLLGALNILFPIVRSRLWAVALAFGLVHGFGFASVLGELGLNRSNLAIGLLGFNVGVELGQLAVVGLFVPFSFMFRRTQFYRASLVPAGAVAIALLSLYWFAVRALGTTFA